MDTYALKFEIASIRSRTNRFILASALLHIVAGVVCQSYDWYRPELPEPEKVIEISWIEKVPADQGIAIVNTTPARVATRKNPKKKDSPVEVPGAAETGERLNRHFTSLESRIGRKALAASIATPVHIKRPKAASSSLARQAGRQQLPLETGRSEPVDLEHAPGRKEIHAMPVVEPVKKAGYKTNDEDPKSVSVGGIKLSGPVADRDLLQYDLPAYPEWAKKSGIESSVMLHFVVLPDGRIKENILIDRSSGFEEFDSGAKNALSGWRFESLPRGAVSEQWGKIVFDYRLGGSSGD
ncbi:MAG: energy transducer TonB [Candidatus Krumholzibacteriota bacterium]|nr:energy transducer TonB [Candidatus Krumholzibacteriota bacterium]